MNILASDAPHMPYSYGNNLSSTNSSLYNSPNMVKGTVAEQLVEDQPPLGTQFKSYELNQATNFYTLDPFQYSITKFDYSLPDGQQTASVVSGANNSAIPPGDYKNNPGLIYRGVNFEKLLPSYTAIKKSANDFPAQSYHRFMANEGYFNPQESIDNSDLWYYGAANNARMSSAGIAGAPLNVQEVNHIIFPEPQRGGTNTALLTKYSWSNFTAPKSDSWEGQNIKSVNNNQNCQFFNYNSGYTTDRTLQPFDNVYSFDSNYCRNIGISPEYTGSMPFNPTKTF